MKRQFLILMIAFTFVSGCILAQTPYDNYAPEQGGKEMLQLPKTQFQIANNDLKDSIRYLIFDKDNLSLSLYKADNSIIGTVQVSPLNSKFTTMDRFAEKYPWQSPYCYAANNPIKYVDVNGDSIWFSYQYDKNKELSGVTMHVTGKVINESSNSDINMQDATKRINNQLESSFSGESNGVSFTTDSQLSVANSMNDVKGSDHLFVLADIGMSDVNGGSNAMGGKVAFISADYFSGPWDTSIGNMGPRTAGHEFGHLAGLEHSNDYFNLMRQGAGSIWGTSATSINVQQIGSINRNQMNLNQGQNYELVPTVVNGSVVLRPKPNRGILSGLIKY